MQITKYQYLSLRRDAIIQNQLCNCASLRTVAVTCQHIDKILKALKSDEGWTDVAGQVHFGSQLYMHDVDKDHISDTLLDGTPQAYRK